MKKVLLLFSIYCIINTYAYSQVAYYDAIKLKTYLSNGKFNPNLKLQIDTILSKYTIGPDDTPSSTFGDNPFIKDFFQRGESHSLISGLSKSIGTSVGNLNVTNFADGIAKFLVERVKQELSTAFFERFRKDLDQNEQLRIIFPATFNALRVIDKEIYNYSIYLDLLRESFQKDLAFLIPNIDKLVNDQSMDIIFSTCPEVRIMLADALYFVNEFSEGKFPGEVFHNYVVYKANENSLNEINKYIFPSLKTLDLFSQSLRSKQRDQYWVSSDSLKLLFIDKTTFQIYSGLIFQQAVKSQIQFDNTSFSSKLEPYAGKIDSLILLIHPYLVGLVDRGTSISNYYKAIKDKQYSGKDKPDYQDYYSVYDASVNYAEYITQSPFLDKLIPKRNTLSNLNNYFISFRSLGNIYVDSYEKQYTSAIVEFTGLMQTLLSQKIQVQINTNNDAISKSIDKGGIIVLEIMNTKLAEILKSNSLILKYGSLAASISKAETSDDVKKAIEAIALPSGSSRIKRETPFNVALNAYTGLFVGYEKITGLKDKHLINNYGLTAPIGVTISTGAHKFCGLPRNRDGHWSYSAFVSLVDIGAVAAFRFQNTDSIAQVPTIQLKDIFSPGLFLSIGIPKCPLSFNLGAQVGPNLRSVYIEDKDNPGKYINGYQDNVYWRFSASIVVDLPLLNFYTRSK